LAKVHRFFACVAFISTVALTFVKRSFCAWATVSFVTGISFTVVLGLTIFSSEHPGALALVTVIFSNAFTLVLAGVGCAWFHLVFDVAIGARVPIRASAKIPFVVFVPALQVLALTVVFAWHEGLTFIDVGAVFLRIVPVFTCACEKWFFGGFVTGDTA